MIRPSGGQPPAGLSAAPGVGRLKGVIWWFKLSLISNTNFEHRPPDLGINPQPQISTTTSRQTTAKNQVK
jgi:hypothetical protein